MQKKYSLLSSTSEMGDNVLKACPSIQWSLIQWVHPALVGSNPNHTIYAFPFIAKLCHICHCIVKRTNINEKCR